MLTLTYHLFVSLFISALFVVLNGQNLNVIPELFRPYVNEFPELQTFNILGNVSDALFTSAKHEASVSLGSYMYQSSYDFIIIGSGPAGCVLANRLSANPDWYVLLIEAGPPESVIQSIPLATMFQASSKYVRNYFFERSSGACLNIVDKECPFQTGVALGGSSVVNNVVYTRGNRKDFDEWHGMGIEGWSYDDVLPYFKKIEKRHIGKRDFSTEAADGLLNIEQPRYSTGLLPVYLRAAQELGQPVIDYNGESQMGIGIVQGTTLNGKRLSAAGAYIHPIYKERPNLHILTNARATKIFIDSENKTAYAVQYKSDGVRTTVTASKEIILSAGAIGSAHLLMLSGVGPKKQLDKINVTTLADLPVGQAFMTNIEVHAPHFLLNTTGQTLHIKRIGLNTFLQFNAGRGALTSFSGTEALAFLSSPSSKLPRDQPDVELSFVSAGMQSDLGMGFRKASQIKESVYEAVFKPIESPQLDSWSTVVMNMHSKTRGRMKLVDNDINTDPIIHYPFFEDQSDMDSLIFGLQESIKLSETPTFKSVGVKMHDIPLPSCAHYPTNHTEYWDCYVRHVTKVTPQMIATNKMGPDVDPESVVDSNLRVRGIRNLRVADTSVIPTTISGHLQAISYVIGEKLADILKSDWTSISNDIPESVTDD